MWPDNETVDDLVGFDVHADLLRAVVMDDRLLPVTIGLYGDWGGGKSSIMKMLERSLKAETWPEESAEHKQCLNVVVLPFNGWQFEGYDDAKAAILEAILQALIENKRFGAIVRNKAVDLLKSVNWMRVAKLGFVATAGAVAGPATAYLAAQLSASTFGSKLAGHLPSPDDARGLVEKAAEGSADESKKPGTDSHGGYDGDIRTFQARFKKMLEESKIDRLVVLIDDLDRCSAERIIENLEAVKLFLNVPRTAFVIGADRRIIRHAIEWRYRQNGNVPGGAGEPDDRIVEDYLEKLIQIPYRLPRLSPAETETYLTLLYCGLILKDEQFGKCLIGCEGVRESSRFRAFGYGDVREALGGNLPEELEKALAFCAAASPLIHQALKGNPRQIKRFLNAVSLRQRLAAVAGLRHQDDVLVKLMALEYAKPSLFTQLYNWQAAQDGHPKELAELEADVRESSGNDDKKKQSAAVSGWDDGIAKRWLSTEPALADIDLRDYFWLARDSLQVATGGVSMVPPLVRAVLTGLLSRAVPEQQAAVASAKNLEPDERSTLLDLFKSTISRKPAELQPYDGLLRLIGEGIPGAADCFLAALKIVPVKTIPPALAPKLQFLQRGLKSPSQALGEALVLLEASDSRVGRALKSSGKGS